MKAIKIYNNKNIQINFEGGYKANGLLSSNCVVVVGRWIKINSIVKNMKSNVKHDRRGNLHKQNCTGVCLYVCISVCLYAVHVLVAQRGQERASDPLGLQLSVVVSHRVAARNRAFGKAASALPC